jgi:hypothetical protein
VRDNQPLLRITPWPSQVVEPVPVDRWGAVLFEDGSILWRGQPKLNPVPLPDEFVLRQLLDVDLGSPEAVVEFVNEHGPILRVWSLEPSFGERHWTDAEGVRHDVGDHGMAGPLADPNVTHVLDVVAYLRKARELVDVLTRHQGGDELSPHEWGEFAEALNHGLDTYSVRVEATFDGYSRHAPRPDLYSAMCLQVFNMLVEDLPVRRCANETCGRHFYRQLGRAQHGQHRLEGVRFCSKTCAKAQTQREYRRRNRKGKNS